MVNIQQYWLLTLFYQTACGAIELLTPLRPGNYYILKYLERFNVDILKTLGDIRYFC